MAPLKIRGLRGVWLLLPPTLLLGVVVEIIPGVSLAGMLAVVGGVDYTSNKEAEVQVPHQAGISGPHRTSFHRTDD